MKKNLPYHRTRLVFIWSVIILSIMGLAYRKIVIKEPSAVLLLRFLPLLLFRLMYKAEYQHRITEKICRALRKSHALHILIPLFSSSIAAVFHHQRFLNWFLPLSFVFSQFAIEHEEESTFDARLTNLLIEAALYFVLSIKLTYYSAAALTVAVISIVLLLRLMVHDTQEEWDFWKAVSGLAVMILWIGAILPQLLDRLFYIAVSQEDFLVIEGCMEVFTAVRPWGQAELIFTNFRDLLPYPPGYLIAKLGWLSVLPLLCVTSTLVVSGFCLAFQKIPRHTSTLASGFFVIMVIRLLSFYLKGASIIVGFEDCLFFDGNILDVLLAIVIIQPINPKPLNEVHSDDPDYHMMQTCAIIMLPHSREGAEILGEYIFNRPNHVGWCVFCKEFLPFFSYEERKMYLLRSADLFDTHNELKKAFPEIYEEKEDPLLCITQSSSSSEV